MAEINIQDLVGTRCLLAVKFGYGEPSVDEFRIIEISPSGNWVKLMNLNGRKFWKPVFEVRFVEQLRDIKTERPKDANL